MLNTYNKILPCKYQMIRNIIKFVINKQTITNWIAYNPWHYEKKNDIYFTYCKKCWRCKSWFFGLQYVRFHFVLRKTLSVLCTNKHASYAQLNRHTRELDNSRLIQDQRVHGLPDTWTQGAWYWQTAEEKERWPDFHLVRRNRVYAPSTAPPFPTANPSGRQPRREWQLNHRPLSQILKHPPGTLRYIYP